MHFALMPHGYCFLWDTALTSLHASSDIAIAAAYLSMPIMMYLHRDRADRETRPLLLMFAAFIFSCGVGHGLAAWNIWHDSYWIEGFWKIVTASVSLATAWLLQQKLPRIMGIYSHLNEAERLAVTDPLTGVSNRMGLEEAFKQLSLGRQKPQGCLVLIDLDHFKEVNDTYGHTVGDLVLQQVAQTLKQRTRATDIIARLGGDEFAILLLECSLHEGKRIAEEIRLAIAQLTLNGDAGVHGAEQSWDGARDGAGQASANYITASIGIAPVTPQQSYEQMYHAVDQLLYRSKNDGRNQVAYPSSESEIT
jgi:diguanylate cyclase (GGDEF)-like protein